MSNELREQSASAAPDSGGPLRHFRLDRRAVLQSLATGMGAAVFASTASAAGHSHHAAAVATEAAPVIPSTLQFFDPHSFDTLGQLAEQIVPGSRAARIPEFLDRLLFVESTATQKRFVQALGAFERVAREAQGKPWKLLSEAEATALLTKMSTLPTADTLRGSFDALKATIAEAYFASEPGMKELGYNQSIAFAPPPVCTTA